MPLFENYKTEKLNFQEKVNVIDKEEYKNANNNANNIEIFSMLDCLKTKSNELNKIMQQLGFEELENLKFHEFIKIFKRQNMQDIKNALKQCKDSCTEQFDEFSKKLNIEKEKENNNIVLVSIIKFLFNSLCLMFDNVDTIINKTEENLKNEYIKILNNKDVKRFVVKYILENIDVIKAKMKNLNYLKQFNEIVTGYINNDKKLEDQIFNNKIREWGIVNSKSKKGNRKNNITIKEYLIETFINEIKLDYYELADFNEISFCELSKNEELNNVNGKNLQTKYTEKNKIKINSESKENLKTLRQYENKIEIKEISDCVKNGENIINEMKAEMEDLGKIFAEIDFEDINKMNPEEVDKNYKQFLVIKEKIKEKIKLYNETVLKKLVYIVEQVKIKDKTNRALRLLVINNLSGSLVKNDKNQKYKEDINNMNLIVSKGRKRIKIYNDIINIVEKTFAYLSAMKEKPITNEEKQNEEEKPITNEEKQNEEEKPITNEEKQNEEEKPTTIEEKQNEEEINTNVEGDMKQDFEEYFERIPDIYTLDPTKFEMNFYDSEKKR